MDYRIRGLSPEPFRHLYGLYDEELIARGAKRYIVDANPGFPDRIVNRLPTLTSDRRPTLTMPWGRFRGPALGFH